jgi:hypothetical protein
MNRRVLLAIVVVVLLVVVAVGAGGFAYQLGMSHGLAANPQLVAPQGSGGVPVAPFYYGMPGFYGRPFGWGGFGFLGCLFPLLGIFLFFGLMRAIFWGGRWGGRRGWGGHGWQGYGPEGQSVPPMFDEWHKRAHGEQTPPGPAQPNQ